jgi:carbamoyl-phosphate synthase small subunit
MLFKNYKKTKLVLEDKTVYDCYSFGFEKSVSGEVVFNTGMVGYPESFTDPSYNGQILTLTYPLIGNYGVPTNIKENNLQKYFESDKIQIQALIVSEFSINHNHWNSNKSLSEWLKENKIPAVFGIDTRALTKKLREKGVMLGKIIINEEDIKIEDPNKRNLVDEVSIKKPVIYNRISFGNSKIVATEDFAKQNLKIIVIDCGVKNNIIRSLLKRSLTVIRVPWNYDFFKEQFDGILISNGPGDPKMCKETIKNIKKAIDMNIPIFGICLGNQILALAAGADTYKLKYGHRSQNQPCIEVRTKKCYITSQNHGFAVNTETLKEEWQPWFVNANDNTNEGIIHKSGLFMGFQAHPEHSPGPRDLEFLFDDFIKIVNEHKK